MTPSGQSVGQGGRVQTRVLLAQRRSNRIVSNGSETASGSIAARVAAIIGAWSDLRNVAEPKGLTPQSHSYHHPDGLT